MIGYSNCCSSTFLFSSPRNLFSVLGASVCPNWHRPPVLFPSRPGAVFPSFPGSSPLFHSSYFVRPRSFVSIFFGHLNLVPPSVGSQPYHPWLNHRISKHPPHPPRPTVGRMSPGLLDTCSTQPTAGCVTPVPTDALATPADFRPGALNEGMGGRLWRSPDRGGGGGGSR